MCDTALDMKMLIRDQVHGQDIQLAIDAIDDFGVVHREAVLHNPVIAVNDVLSGVHIII